MSNVGHKSAKERISERIKASAIAKRLQDFALAKPSDEGYIENQMTQGQVAAARVLLGKVLPDQKAIEQTIKDERVKTKAEINAALLSSGLNPEEIWQSIRKH